MPKFLFWLLIISGSTALLSYSDSMEGLVLPAINSIIGIPIALYIMASTSIFMFCLLTAFFSKFVFNRSYGIFLSIILATIIWGAIPPLLNFKITQSAKYYTAQDFMFNSEPQRANVVAFTGDRAFLSNSCSELCQNLLINKDVKYVAYIKNLPDMTTGKIIGGAAAYTLVKKENCTTKSIKYGTYKNKLRLLELDGQCLDRVPFHGQIDLLIQAGYIMNRKKRESAFGIGNSLKRAFRVSMWRHTKSGMEQIHRATDVSLDELFQPMMLSQSRSGRTGMSITLGFQRKISSSIAGLAGQSGPRSIAHLVLAAIKG